MFIFALCAALLATIGGPLLNLFYRNGYVFIDHEVFPGFSRLLYGVMVGNALYADVLFALYCAAVRIPAGLWVVLIFSVLLSLFFLMINLVSGKLTDSQGLRARKPQWKFKFAAGASVFDVGTGDYAVVFATSKRSQGYVTYRYGGEEKISRSADGGVRRMGLLHCCLIPREELENNRYQIHAVRVKDRLAYGGLMGKKIDGPVYNFKGVRNVKNPRFVSASDWHFHKDRFVAAAQFVENPDIFLFLGDGADYYVNDRQTIACLFAPLALVTGGRIPILFTRGNHEVRADYDNADLWRKIGLKDGYNHRVERGDFLFTILDSAECDKEDNADWEHMDVYDMERYTEHTLTYLDSLAPRPDKYNILLVHDRTFMKEKNDRRVRYNAQVHRLGIQLNISGDSHHFVYFEHPEEGVVRGFEDGGVFVRTNYPYPKHLLNIFTRAVTGFTLAQIDFSDNEITFKEIDDLGAEIKSYTIPR